MQRILRINVQSRNQTLRATRKAERAALNRDWGIYNDRLSRTERKRQEYIRAEKKSRREDWMLGPLAPKRDIGAKTDFYGVVDTLLLQGAPFPDRMYKGPKSEGWSPVGMEGRIEEQVEWEGTGNEGNVVEGDRVVVVRGKPGLVGQIGKVKEVSRDSKEVKIEGLNLVSYSTRLLYRVYMSRMSQVC
jgi:large subunit ribosomal protein L24